MKTKMIVTLLALLILSSANRLSHRHKKHFVEPTQIEGMNAY